MNRIMRKTALGGGFSAALAAVILGSFSPHNLSKRSADNSKLLNKPISLTASRKLGMKRFLNKSWFGSGASSKPLNLTSPDVPTDQMAGSRMAAVEKSSSPSDEPAYEVECMGSSTDFIDLDAEQSANADSQQSANVDSQQSANVDSQPSANVDSQQSANVDSQQSVNVDSEASTKTNAVTEVNELQNQCFGFPGAQFIKPSDLENYSYNIWEALRGEETAILAVEDLAMKSLSNRFRLDCDDAVFYIMELKDELIAEKELLARRLSIDVDKEGTWRYLESPKLAYMILRNSVSFQELLCCLPWNLSSILLSAPIVAQTHQIRWNVLQTIQVLQRVAPIKSYLGIIRISADSVLCSTVNDKKGSPLIQQIEVGSLKDDIINTKNIRENLVKIEKIAKINPLAVLIRGEIRFVTDDRVVISDPSIGSLANTLNPAFDVEPVEFIGSNTVESVTAIYAEPEFGKALLELKTRRALRAHHVSEWPEMSTEDNEIYKEVMGKFSPK